MNLGTITGTVVCTRKLDNLQGMKFLIVETINPDGKRSGNFTVAVDTIGSGVGETVMVVSGSSARQSPQTTGKPVDSAIIAKVDKVELAP